MKFSNIVRVETHDIDDKVLAAKHMASLQLLCTVGGNQARLDARTEFKILERSPKGGGGSWSSTKLYGGSGKKFLAPHFRASL
jgi:hypothetical protein